MLMPEKISAHAGTAPADSGKQSSSTSSPRKGVLVYARIGGRGFSVAAGGDFQKRRRDARNA